jgi:hypothetical protein
MSEQKNNSVGLLASATPAKGSQATGIARKIISTPVRKFFVRFRRPYKYHGEYGFDWLRDEYVYPMTMVTNDHNGTPINTDKPLCPESNIATLKSKYPKITIHGRDYHPAWLSIFPNTTTAQFKYGSSIHKDGVNLDLEVEEIDALSNDGAKIVFECSSPHIILSKTEIDIKDIVTLRRISVNITGYGSNNTKTYYYLKDAINIKCKGGALSDDTPIRIYAVLNFSKVEAGRLMVYKNNDIPKAEFVVVNVITDATRAHLRNDYQDMFKYRSFNQALIRAEVVAVTTLDLQRLQTRDKNISDFLRDVNSMDDRIILRTIVSFYQSYGKYKVQGGINSNNTNRTYLFATTINRGGVKGCAYRNDTIWGNAYIVFNAGLQDGFTIIHEAGHSFSLPHIFEDDSSLTDIHFYQGYTDNYMDYTWQAGNMVNRRMQPSGDNMYIGRMFSFFKWQWDIMRKDRSLIRNY